MYPISFNPSQVQFTHFFAFFNFSSISCFNPSQVQFTQINFHQVFFDKKMFQSLTGSIHTHTISVRKIDDLKSFNPSQVQFTHFGVNVIRSVNVVFQSLTGSIHTSEVSGGPKRLFEVSIPHRFNSHRWNLFLPRLGFCGFNPSQVQFTHYPPKPKPPKKPRFNPSQVQFTPRRGY